MKKMRWWWRWRMRKRRREHGSSQERVAGPPLLFSGLGRLGCSGFRTMRTMLIDTSVNEKRKIFKSISRIDESFISSPFLPFISLASCILFCFIPVSRRVASTHNSDCIHVAKCARHTEFAVFLFQRGWYWLCFSTPETSYRQVRSCGA